MPNEEDKGHFLRFHCKGRKRVSCIQHKNSKGEKDYKDVSVEDICRKCGFLVSIEEKGIYCKAPKKRTGPKRQNRNEA